MGEGAGAGWRNRRQLLNLILIYPEDFIQAADRARLTGRRLRHVQEVHRAEAGTELCVGVLGGRIGKGTVTLLSGSALELDVRLEREPPPKLPLTLILALPRPKVIKRVLRCLSAMGVGRIVLINCFRVEKSYWQSPVLKDEGLREQLALGLEQAKDTVFPEVLLRPLFKPFVEDELPGIIRDAIPLVAHPNASSACPRDVKRSVTLAIGPEGGFIQYELDKLVTCGFTPVSMGDRVLSTETAVPALISRLF